MAENYVTKEFDLVVIGGSAGSLDVVLRILPQLRLGSSVSIILVMHRKNTYDFSLSDLLATKTDWKVREADEKQLLEKDTIYLAPADYHLLIENDHTLSLDVSEKVNYSRPSIDVTFESAADVYGPRVAAILLSGANDDGVDGLQKVKSVQGLTIVQDPATASVAYMPQHAIDNVDIDIILPPDELGVLINRIAVPK
ncbi:MAG: chemotaxis protein CheB [Chitinophagaceae bacterium]|nr:MAG: chemotaxis protein CheB [Chitinophagaceae bacterium]